MTRSRRVKSPLFESEQPQLGLFDRQKDDSDRRSDDAVELERLRVQLPPRVRFGTSSWTFPGWAELVYHRRYGSQRAFLKESLGEYAAHPLMRTVGIDRGYYTPVPAEDLSGYAAQLPDDFRAAIKVWQKVAMPGFPRHARYGADAGKPNPDFLNPELFSEAVHGPVKTAFATKMGPWILEIAPSPCPLNPTKLAEKLSAFLRDAPRDFPFAVELRDRGLLGPAYVRALRDHGASHVFNYWSRMPDLAAQMRVEGLLDCPIVVARLLLPPGRRYDDLRDAYAPFDRLVEPQPQMRRDVVRLVRTALERDAECFVLVNNKAEGSSPLTVQALAKLLCSPQ